jgi:hypothetical protein
MIRSRRVLLTVQLFTLNSWRYVQIDSQRRVEQRTSRLRLREPSRALPSLPAAVAARGSNLQPGRLSAVSYSSGAGTARRADSRRCPDNAGR